jgi:urea transport system substrate-binding protein
VADLTLVEEEFIRASPDTVFGLLFASEHGALLGASCDSFRRGAVVRFDLPAGGLLGLMQGTARIVEIRHAERLVLEHETPWRGRLTCTIKPSNDGCRVRLVAKISEEALRWLLRRRGAALEPECEPGHIPIGLLTPKSGPGSYFSGAAERLAQLAIEEVNRDGPPTGVPLRLVVGDDGTDPTMGVAEVRRLIEDEGCPVIMTLVTSECFEAISPVVEQAGALLVFCNTNEGGHTSSRIFRLGERPRNQLGRSVPLLMKANDARSWYFVGNDYCWPRAAAACARPIVEGAGGQVVGKLFIPLGTRDFTPLLESIQRSGADMLLSTFVGADAAAFHRQFAEAGLGERCRVLAPALDDSTREHIGNRVSSGLWTVFGYFSDMPTAANQDFLRRYRTRFGDCVPPPSSFSEAVYETVHLVAAAARLARSWHPDDVGKRLVGSMFDGPRGKVTITAPGEFEQTLYLAEARSEGYALRETMN